MCAKLKAPEGRSGLTLNVLAPAGLHLGVCLRINDLFNVERQKYQSQEMELRDVTRFIFGFVGQDGQPYLVQTYEFTISGAPGANLMAFLKAWLGRSPEMGWDYAEMLGKPAQLTIEHKAARQTNQLYADVAAVAPVHPQLLASVPPATHFAAILAQLEQSAPGQQQQRGQPPAGSVPPAQRGYPPAQPPQQPPAQQQAPAAPLPPVDTRQFYVHHNGSAVLMNLASLVSYPPTAPACVQGETTWKTVADFIPKQQQPPAPPAQQQSAPPPPPGAQPQQRWTPPAQPGQQRIDPTTGQLEDVPF